MRASVLALTALAALAPPAAGQVCAGVPLGERPVAVTAGVSLADGWSGWRAGVDARPSGESAPPGEPPVGGLDPLVVSAVFTVFDYDGAEVGLRRVSGGAAWEVRSGPLSLCPRATLAYAWPDDDRFSIDAWTGAATTAAGIDGRLGPVTAIAFVDAGVALTRASADGRSDTTADGILTAGVTASGSRLFGTVAAEATTADGVDPALALAIGALFP